MSQKAEPPPPGAIVVHSLADARAALDAAIAAGATVHLFSPPGFASYGGVGLFHALVRAVGARDADGRVTMILDCDDAPGHVLSGLREGVRDFVFTGRGSARERLRAILDREGARLWPRPKQALDLGAVDDRDAACCAWLAGD